MGKRPFLWSPETGDPLTLNGTFKSWLSMPITGSVEKGNVDLGGPNPLPNTKPCPWCSFHDSSIVSFVVPKIGLFPLSWEFLVCLSAPSSEFSNWSLEARVNDDFIWILNWWVVCAKENSVPSHPHTDLKICILQGRLSKRALFLGTERVSDFVTSRLSGFSAPSASAKCSASDCHSSNCMLLSCSCFCLIKRNEGFFFFFFCTCKINTNQNCCYSLIHSGLWSTSAFLFSHWECTAQEGLQREENRLPLPIWLTRFNAAIMLWKFITWERLWCGCPQCLGTRSFYLKCNQAPTVRGCVKSCLSWGRWNFHLM